MLKVLVSRQGTALKIEIAHSSGHEILDKAAADAVRNWHFVPARKGNSPMEEWVQVPVAFRLRTWNNSPSLSEFRQNQSKELLLKVLDISSKAYSFFSVINTQCRKRRFFSSYIVRKISFSAAVTAHEPAVYFLQKDRLAMRQALACVPALRHRLYRGILHRIKEYRLMRQRKDGNMSWSCLGARPCE